MDPQVIARKIIPKLNKKCILRRPPVYLSIPPNLSKFQWKGGDLEALIEKFLDHILGISHPAMGVRVAVRERERMSDLEKFFSVFPAYWFHLGIASQTLTGFKDELKKILESFGYHCPEWVGVEDSESQLGAFYFKTQEIPALILFVQNSGAHRNCDILIPVLESACLLAHAV